MIGIDCRSLLESQGRISGVENYTVSIVNRLMAGGHSGSYRLLVNSARDAGITTDLQVAPEKIWQRRIPNKLLNLSVRLFGRPRFENLYRAAIPGMNVLWLPDIRPFAVRRSTKVALTIHDLSPLVHPEFFSWQRRIWHRFVRFPQAIRRADLVLAVSEYTKAEVVARCKVAPEKVLVAYPGVDLQRFRFDLDGEGIAEVCQRLQLPPRFILAVSTLEPRKNILGLIRAFEKIADPDAGLVIAGRPGWLYQPILQAIQASPKAGKIKLLGYVSEGDKPYLYAAATTLCYPSFYEGFGLVCLEAMACGTPVVTSARTSMPEVCGDAALLVEPYRMHSIVAGLDAMLGSQDLRREYRRRGLARAQAFSWDATAAAVDAALQQLDATQKT